MQGYGGMPQGYPGPVPSYMYAQPGHPNGAIYPSQPIGIPPYQLTRPQNARYDSGMRGGGPVNPYAVPPGPPYIPDEREREHEREGRTSRFRRSVDGRTSEPTKRPLKSAMKKSKKTDPAGPGPSLHRSGTVPPSMEEVGRRRSHQPEMKAEGPLIRTRTTSDPARTRANSFTRPRSGSRTYQHYTPAQLFLSVTGTNALTMTSVMHQEIVDYVRERVLGMWPEGVLFQMYRNETNEFKVQFSGNPWSAKGDLGLMAMKMIIELFAVLARQGYTCTSAIDMGHMIKAPKLVFSLTQPDPGAEFFMMAFSGGRRKIKFINAPEQYCLSLADVLRDVFPRKVLTSVLDENDTYKIELNRLDFENTADLMIATILQHTTSEGYKLEGTIPLTNTGFWSLIQGRKELWIFRRLPRIHPSDMQ